jgi:putative Mg2+ transporter-C (MgtC) family protein
VEVSEAEGLLRLVLAAGFGAAIGFERESRRRPAGVRTFAIVALGSALFTLVGIVSMGEGDATSRIAAQIVTGVGFLGAGTIIQQRGSIVGLTTAAGIWSAAAVGMGFGFGLYLLSAGATVIMLVVLRVIGQFVEAQSGDGTDTRPGPDTTAEPAQPEDSEKREEPVQPEDSAKPG